MSGNSAERMRIAFVCDAGDNHNYKWIKLLSERHDVIVICRSSQAANNLFTGDPGIKLFPLLPDTFPLRQFGERARILREIKRVIEENQIEIIHSIYAYPYALWAYLIGFRNHIVTTYGSDMLVDYKVRLREGKGIKQKLVNHFMKKMLERSLQKARFITSTSMSQQRVLRTMPGINDKLHLVRTGVNAGRLLPVYASLKRTFDGITVFSNRAMTPLYNIHLIIEAFSILEKKNKYGNFRLLLKEYYANEDYARSIRQQIKDLQLRHVDIYPDQENEDLLQSYMDADVVIMIPSSDGTPVTGIETLLLKRPLIMGSIPYDEDLFNEQTVWKIDSFSPADIAKKIEEVLDCPKDIVQRKMEKGYEAVMAGGTLHNEIEKIERLYRQMVNLES